MPTAYGRERGIVSYYEQPWKLVRLGPQRWVKACSEHYFHYWHKRVIQVYAASNKRGPWHMDTIPTPSSSVSRRSAVPTLPCSSEPESRRKSVRICGTGKTCGISTVSRKCNRKFRLAAVQVPRSRRGSWQLKHDTLVASTLPRAYPPREVDQWSCLALTEGLPDAGTWNGAPSLVTNRSSASCPLGSIHEDDLYVQGSLSWHLGC